MRRSLFVLGLLLGLCGFRGGIPSSAPPPPVGLPTTRTLVNLSNSTSVTAGQVFHFGLAVADGDCPSGQVLQIQDSGSHTLSYQADKKNYWSENNSLQFAVVYAQAAENIAPSGTDTLTISCVSGTWNNDPGLTNYGLPASISTIESNVEAFSGAQNLSFQISSISRDTRIANTATTVGSGNWEALRNDCVNNTGTAANSHVYVTGAGPVALRRFIWCDFVDKSTTTNAHDHLRFAWYEDDYLNNSGGITGIRYMPTVFNGPANASTRVERYDYNWAIQNGASVISSGATPHGTPQTDILDISVSSPTVTVDTVEPHKLVTNDIVYFNGGASGQTSANSIFQPSANPQCTVTVTSTTQFTCTLTGSETAQAISSTTLNGSIGTSTGNVAVVSTTGLTSTCGGNSDGCVALLSDGTHFEYVIYSIVDGTHLNLTTRGYLPKSWPWQSTGAFAFASGATVSVGGTVTGYGGQLARSRAFFARSDAKANWIGTGVEANVEVTLSEAAVHYLTKSGVIPPYDYTTTASMPNPTGTYTFSPFLLGDWTSLTDWLVSQPGAGSGQTYAGDMTIDDAGENCWLGQNTCTGAASLFNYKWATEDRIDAMAFVLVPANGNMVDDNGLPPTLTTTTYTGLSNYGYGAFYNADYILSGTNGQSYATFQSFTEPSFMMPGIIRSHTDGGESYGYIGSHQPQPAAMRYVLDGDDWWLDLIYENATEVLSWIAPSNCVTSCGNDQRDWTVTPPGTHYYGLTLALYSENPRNMAKSTDALLWAADFAPPKWADGTTNGNYAYWRDLIAQNVGYATSYLANQSTYFQSSGAWKPPATGGFFENGGDPWMEGYRGADVALLYSRFKADSTVGTNVTTWANHMALQWTNFENAGMCSWQFGSYEISDMWPGVPVASTNPALIKGLYDWQWWITQPNWQSVCQGGPHMQITTDGWLTMIAIPGAACTPNPGPNPFSIGDSIQIPSYSFSNAGTQTPPTNMANDTTYYVINTSTSDPDGGQGIQVSATLGGSLLTPANGVSGTDVVLAPRSALVTCPPGGASQGSSGGESSPAGYFSKTVQGPVAQGAVGLGGSSMQSLVTDIENRLTYMNVTNSLFPQYGMHAQ